MSTLKNLSSFSDSKEILQNNILAAKKYGVYDLIMEIGSVYHRNNSVTVWSKRSLQDKEKGIFNDYNCFGAICGKNLNEGFKVNSRNNPERIHLNCNIQIDVVNKIANFVYEDEFSYPSFTHQEILEVDRILSKYNFKLGTSNSAIAGA